MKNNSHKSCHYKNINKTIISLSNYLEISPILLVNIFKAIFATGIGISLNLITPFRNSVWQDGGTFVAMVSVFGHPGCKVGAFILKFGMILLGGLLGLSLSLLSRFIAQNIYVHSIHGAFLFLAIVEGFGLFSFGFIRSKFPRLYLFGYLFFILIHFGCQSPIGLTAFKICRAYLYPLLIQLGISLVINIFVFPDVGSSHVGEQSLESLIEVHKMIRDSVNLFLFSLQQDKATKYQMKFTQNGILPFEEKTNPESPPTYLLPELIKRKSIMRKKIADCKNTLSESSFELSYGRVGPHHLKPIIKLIEKLGSSSAWLLDACESLYSLYGREDLINKNSKEFNNTIHKTGKLSKETEKEKEKEKEIEKKKNKKNKKNKKKFTSKQLLKSITVHRDIEFADKILMFNLLNSVHDPLARLRNVISQSLEEVNIAIATSYELKKYSSLSNPFVFFERKKSKDPDLLLQKLDQQSSLLLNAISDFSSSVRTALETLSEVKKVDLMPRDEVFLLSSFLLNYRMIASNSHTLILETHKLLKFQTNRGFKRRVWFPMDLNWRKWLQSGDSELSDSSTPLENTKDLSDIERRENEYQLTRTDTVLTSTSAPTGKIDSMLFSIYQSATVYKFRNKLADIIDYFLYSFDIRFAVRLVVGWLFVTFPAYTPQLQDWYRMNRGSWVGFVYSLVSETSIGNTLWVFVVRLVGTVVGSTWGLASFYAADSFETFNPYLFVVMQLLGCVIGFYVIMKSKYIKAGIMGTISMNIIPLTVIIDSSKNDTIVTAYAKRTLAMVIGGVVSIATQFLLFPVKARKRLVEEVCTAIRKCLFLGATLLYGLESEKNTEFYEITKNTEKKIKKTTKAALSALNKATVYKSFTKNEPRLKGSFKDLAVIFSEIIFVIEQIVERLDNSAHLRIMYGTSLFEDVEALVEPYKRNLSGALLITLSAISDSLTLKKPLPQYMPSCRLAQVRLTNFVREIMMRESATLDESEIRSNDSNKTKEDVPSSSVTSENNFHQNYEKTSDNQSELTDSPSSTQKTRRKSDFLPYDLLSANGSAQGSLKYTPRQALNLKFLSWNATAFSLEEVVEYTEELVELTKLLAGVDEISYGFLSRPITADARAAKAAIGDISINGEYQIKSLHHKNKSLSEIVLSQRSSGSAANKSNYHNSLKSYNTNNKNADSSLGTNELSPTTSTRSFAPSSSANYTDSESGSELDSNHQTHEDRERPRSRAEDTDDQDSEESVESLVNEEQNPNDLTALYSSPYNISAEINDLPLSLQRIYSRNLDRSRTYDDRNNQNNNSFFSFRKRFFRK